MLKNKVLKVLIIITIIMLSLFVWQNRSNADIAYNAIEIQGTVKNNNGNGIENIDVYFAEELKATTDSNGEYSFWVLRKDVVKGKIKYEQIIMEQM